MLWKIGCGVTPNEVFDILAKAYSEYCAVNKNNKEELMGKNNGLKAKRIYNDCWESRDLYTLLDLNDINGERVIRSRNPLGMVNIQGIGWSK